MLVRRNRLSSRYTWILCACAFLSGCGGGGGGEDPLLTGHLIDSPVAGLAYRTASQTGLTGEDGAFRYRSGETIVFSIGSVEWPAVPAAPLITPLTLGNSADPENARVVNSLILLQSLDEDGNPSNGIRIPPHAAGKATRALDFDAPSANFASSGPVLSLVSGVTDRSPVSAVAAIAHFNSTILARGIPVQPKSDAGPSRSVRTGETVTLDGTGSYDLNADPLSFEWVVVSRPAGSTAALSSPRSPKPTFVADVTGDYLLSLSVMDARFVSAPSSVRVSAVLANRAPVANAGPASSVTVGTTVALDGTGSTDPDGDAVTFRWTLAHRPAGSSASLIDTTASRPSLTPDVIGDYVVVLTVDDGAMTAAPATVVVSAAAQNVAPVAVAGSPRYTATGSSVVLDGQRSSDANGDPLTFAWSLVSKPADSRASLTQARSPQASLTPDLSGDYVVALSVNDSRLTSAPSTVLVTATAPVAALPFGLGTHAQRASDGAFLALNGDGGSTVQSTSCLGFSAADIRPDGKVLGVSSSRPSLVLIDPRNGGCASFAEVPEPMIAIAVTTEGDILTLGADISSGSRTMYTFDSSGAERFRLKLGGRSGIAGISALATPRAIDFTPDGRLLALESGVLWEVDRNTGTGRVVAIGVAGSSDIDIDPKGCMRTIQDGVLNCYETSSFSLVHASAIGTAAPFGAVVHR